eukprot:Rhum_TRINITY_DN10224_c0_g1::Rhum_TRINITY_DN10224_c0_g1_i1::g.37428::m.37428
MVVLSVMPGGGTQRKPDVDALASWNRHIPQISRMLLALAKRGDVAQSLQPVSNAYEGELPPSISLDDYLRRWARYSYCSPECFLVAVLYIDKLSAKSGMVVTSLNVHRVLLVALVLAAKTRDDIYFSNKYYASIGGVTTAELNALEVSWLTDTDWDMHVDRERYAQYSREFDRVGGSTKERTDDGSPRAALWG